MIKQAALGTIRHKLRDGGVMSSNNGEMEYLWAELSFMWVACELPKLFTSHHKRAAQMAQHERERLQ